MISVTTYYYFQEAQNQFQILELQQSNEATEVSK